VEEDNSMKAGISQGPCGAFAVVLLSCLVPTANLAAKTIECDLVIGALNDGHLEFQYDEHQKTLTSKVIADGMYVNNNYKNRLWNPVFDKNDTAVFLSVDRQRPFNPVLVLEFDFGANTVVEHRLGNAGVTPGAPKPWTCLARD
jgi:hypothetical protein